MSNTSLSSTSLSSNETVVGEASASWSGFSTSLVTNLVIGSVIFILFYFLRIIYRNFYCARIISSNGEESTLVTSPLEWLRYTYRFPLEAVFESRGIDAYMHLKFLSLCLQFLAIIMVFGIGVLLPINYTSVNKGSGDGVVVNNITLNSLDAVSMASIPSGSKRLWAHTLSIPMFTVLAFFMFRRTYQDYLDKRNRWQSKHHPRNYTVMIKEMSKHITTAQDMSNFFTPFFPNNAILACHIVYRESKLRSKWNRHRSIQRRLDRALAEYQQTRVEPVRAIGWRPACLGGQTEPLIPYLEQKLVDADIDLKNAQRDAGENKELNPMKPLAFRLSTITPRNLLKFANMTSTTGFITFSRMSDASQAVRSVYSKNNNKYQVTPAPEPKNIKWKNLIVPGRERLFRRVFASFIFFILFCFWSFPVAAISAASNIANLSKVPVLDWLVDVVRLNNNLQGLVEGFLPSLALVAFMGLLPLIIRAIIIINKEDSKSMFWHKVFTTYWAFLVVNVFLIVTISGSVLQVLFRILEDLTLSQILTLFGSSLPSQSSFFINYILVQSLTSVPFDILRPIELIVGICRAARETAPGEKLRALSRDDPTALNSVKYARELLIFVITLSYSTLSPFIIPFGLLYFIIDYYVSKYNHIYSFVPKYQSGGTIWPLAFNRLCVGLVIYQITAIGMFILKSFVPGIVISFPFPFITLFYWWRTIRRYKRTTSVLPLNICPDSEFNGTEFIKSYEDPVLNISKLDISHA